MIKIAKKGSHSSIRIFFTGKNFDLSQAQEIDLANIFTVEQIHGKAFFHLKKENESSGRKIQADAIVCQEKNLAIAVKTADCVPILIWDEKGSIAAVHSGWRGTKLKILAEVLEQNFNQTDRKNLHIWIGPSICQNHYEVDFEVAQFFLNLFPEFVNKKNDKYHLNLPAMNQRLCLDFGIPINQIHLIQECTFEAQDLYYSVRREFKKSGEARSKSSNRNYSIIILE